MTESEAAPAAPAEQGSRNLLMRVLAALVLAPVALALAYAGGFLWAALVTLASIGLFVEWLIIVGLARELRIVVPGIAALAISGICLAAARLDAALVILGVRTCCGGGAFAAAAQLVRCRISLCSLCRSRLDPGAA